MLNGVMRIGIYGGTFGPVHKGHVAAAEAFEALAEDYEALAKEGKSSFKGEEKYRILCNPSCCVYLRRKESAKWVVKRRFRLM